MVELATESSLKEEVKDRLSEFIEKYREARGQLKSEEASEQTMRSWIDEFLLIFNWDCKDINQVHQEKMITKEERKKLEEIGSTHTKPDYTLKNGEVRLNFLDAKDLQDDLKNSKEIAFQARSYGYSAGFSCSIVTNIEELVFYSSIEKPHEDESAEKDRKYFTYDEYVERFDEIFELLYRENVINGEQQKVLFSDFDKIDPKNLDDTFAELLEEFRFKLAEDIVQKNGDLKNIENSLNSILQSIVNKILFIRISEGRGLVEENTLKKLLDGNFWENFIKKSEEDYEENFDGPIFGDLDNLKEISLDNSTFERFISNLYDSSYKFDVIPIKLFTDMYERFLGSEIIYEDDRVYQQEKDFYIKQNGAISTPKYLVDFLIDQTFKGLKEVNSLDELLELKILEPACGSGTFLLGILEYLENKAIELYEKGKVSEKQENLFVSLNDQLYPTAELKRKIITNCIYAIDMDQHAVEVAKMSLALKLVDNYSLPYYNEELGLNKKLLLSEIGENIIHGNTLVSMDILDEFNLNTSDIKVVVPLDIFEELPNVFTESSDSGFDYIVGNPPYVETKHFIEDLPYCRDYFRKTYDMDDQKADMSIYFIEKSLELLNPRGKVGFLCQRRFFKTGYGEKTRKYLSENKSVDTIVEFDSSRIFKGRTTYVALMVFSKTPNQNDSFNYIRMVEEPVILRNRLVEFSRDKYYKKDLSILTKDSWNFTDNEDLEKLIKNLKDNFDSLNSLKERGICDIHGGIQVLRNDVYYITDAKVDSEKGMIVGKNRRKGSSEETELRVELDICRPIVANKDFNKKFQTIEPNYFAIVPYTVDETKPINFTELSKRFPECARYLSSQKEYIRENNKQMKQGDEWHLFTRTTGLRSFNNKKILFPMTKKEIVASYCPEPIYPDNSNMWGLTFKDEDDDFHLAVTAILNSKLFSVLAIYESNPQANGYRKLNKQFVLPVPLPYNKLREERRVVKDLKDFAIEINKLDQDLEAASSSGEIRGVKALLRKSYEELNNYVYSLYELNAFEKYVIEDSYTSYMTVND